MGHVRLAASAVALFLLLGATLSTSTADYAEVTPLPPVEDTDGRGGICYSYYPGDPERPYLPLAHNAGARWDRFDFIWPNIEQGNNNWHFEGYDDLVHDMGDAGTNVVGILLWTPGWLVPTALQEEPPSRPAEKPAGWYAASLLSPQAPPGASAAPPPGLNQPWNDWTTSDGDPINYWGRYVHKVVSRYSDPSRFDKPVRHWEIWNEVDDGDWNYFWTGSEADYAQLLKVGYQATKDACPECTVLYGGLLFWADEQYYERVLDILNDDPEAPGNDYYFDVMSLHLYSRSSTTYDKVNHVRSRVKALTSDHPIWLTETGVMVWDDGAVDPDPTKYDLAATQQEAASYVIQSYANAWASDVERYFFFRANDEDMHEYFGLMRNDQSFRPSYVGYQVATRYLISPTMVTNWSYSGGIRRVTLWGTPHGKVSVLWNTRPDPTTFAYDATLPTATWIDQRGNAQTISSIDDVYHLTLPGATANRVYPHEDDYFIGGEPYLIIEDDTLPPSETVVTPLPPTTYSDTIHVSWSASDDRAGVWGAEIEVREGATGSWSPWLGLAHTQGTWSANYDLGQHDTVYCFRARAWDHAGNLGPWSTEERCTRLSVSQEVQVSLGPVFGDQNGNGSKDEDETTLDSVTFRLVDSSGVEIATGDGQSWALTTTLRVDEYTVIIEPQGRPSPPPGWLPRRLSIAVAGGGDPLFIERSPIGLLRHRSSSYLPLVASADS